MRPPRSNSSWAQLYQDLHSPDQLSHKRAVGINPTREILTKDSRSSPHPLDAGGASGISKVLHCVSLIIQEEHSWDQVNAWRDLP